MTDQLIKPLSDGDIICYYDSHKYDDYCKRHHPKVQTWVDTDRLRELFAELLKEQYGWLNSKGKLVFSVDVEKCKELFSPLMEHKPSTVNSKDSRK